jgi:hypothetical protein
VAERRQSQRLPLAWWPLAVGIAAALKWHFSVAAASELLWMLRPLSLLLQLLTGWHFRSNADGEWQSLDAGIVLVKACAGINFMVLSLLGWCWMLRPKGSVPGESGSVRGARAWMLLLEWPALLCTAGVFAWLTTLAVNALRILAIVHLQPALELWLAPPQAHRLIGLLVYLPALSLQLVLADRRHWRRAVLVGCGLYAALILVMPLLTGNARLTSPTYWQHAGIVLPVLMAVVLISLCPRHARSAVARS